MWFRFCFIFSVTQLNKQHLKHISTSTYSTKTKSQTLSLSLLESNQVEQKDRHFVFTFVKKREKLYFVAAITLSLKNPKFIIMENFKREPVEEPVAKRRRLEPWIAEEIIQNQQLLIESLRVEIAIKNKIIQEFRDQEQNYFESLPDECLLKIFSFLSNYDVLRRVAR